MKMKLFLAYGVLAVMLAPVFIACEQPIDPDPNGPGNNGPSAITYTVAQTGGADGVTDSAAIVFTFSASVDSLNLTATDITVSGKASKGSAVLTGSGTSRTLPITVNAAGTATVSINKDGIETATKSVTVFKQGQMAPETVIVTWNFNGGTAGTGAQHPTQIDKGNTLAKPSPDPTKSGNIFDGWYTDSGLTQTYNFANAVTANLNLYAKWAAGQTDPAHTHQWGDWTATTIAGTEQRVCEIDQSHIEHRLTGAGRFTFYGSSSTSWSIGKGTATGEIYIPAYFRSSADSEYLAVTGITNDAFAGTYPNNNTSLTAVHIPSTVTSIGDGAFGRCISLTSIIIPEGVTSIGREAFWGCTNLTSIIIPASVTSMGYGAFSTCTRLTNITIESGNYNYTSEGGILYNKAKTALVAYPSASGSVTIPASVTSIGGSAFENCTSLTSITIPEGVTRIDLYAFNNCTSLTSITIPASVTSMGNGGAFGGWTNTQTIYVAGHASEAAADSAWGGTWRSSGNANIVYQGQ